MQRTYDFLKIPVLQELNLGNEICLYSEVYDVYSALGQESSSLNQEALSTGNEEIWACL